MPLSSLPFLNFSEELPEVVRRELEQYTAKLRNFLLVSLNEDGTLRTANNNDNPPPIITNNTTGPGTGIEEEQWWKKGPWTLDDPNAALDNVVGLRPPDPPAGTYNDYAPPGIESAVVLEIDATGNITLTGLQRLLTTRKRMLIVRNRDAAFSITLKHNSTSSLLGNRFSLPGSADVVLAPGENIWLYYDLGLAAWTAAISIPSGVVTTSPELTFSNADIVAATSKEIVGAPGTGRVIWPLFLQTYSDFTSPAGGYLTTRDLQVKYASGSAVNLINANSAIQNTATKQYTYSTSVTLASLGTNSEDNVAVNAVPSGGNTFLGVPPSNYFLRARLVYTTLAVPTV